jgi:hypothetical protein
LGDEVLSAGVEIERIAEGVIGGVILAVVIVVVTVQTVRWIKRRPAPHEPGVPALARFVDSATTDASAFGGGAWSARVRRRRDTVTYGYLGVAEEYFSEDSGGRWCTLTVNLPGRVPFLVADNRAATGRTGVPMQAPHRISLDDPPFDATYLIGTDEPDAVPRVLSPGARDVLLRAPVQRLSLNDSQLQLRTFDGVVLDDDLIGWLDAIAARFLASTPSFVRAAKAPAASSGAVLAAGAPLPEGFYGPNAD